METKVINGTTFKVSTPDKVCNILNDAMISRRRLKLMYGNLETGKSWNEEYDIIGYVGRSTGNSKIPLLIANSRSMGGGAILDDCILKITDVKTGQCLYKHENIKEQTFEIVPSDMAEYSHNVLIDGQLYSRHRTERSAKMLISKLK